MVGEFQRYLVQRFTLGHRLIKAKHFLWQCVSSLQRSNIFYWSSKQSRNSHALVQKSLWRLESMLNPHFFEVYIKMTSEDISLVSTGPSLFIWPNSLSTIFSPRKKHFGGYMVVQSIQRKSK